MQFDDTIAALSTAAAPAARIILRVAGPAAHSIACSLCDVQAFAAGSATRQFLSFNDLRFPVWVYAFCKPHSYTGDDLIEFHLPGSPVLAKLLLDELFSRGVRPAEPGEFTARAYFNGKMDLTEAEGVAATIAAGNTSELRAARQLMAGELARRLNPIMDGLAQTLALIEVGIDFSEEDVTFLAADELRRQIQSADDALADLLNRSSRFESLSHEPRVVLVGKPNSGKSSLINALTDGHRAVVSDQAGTTRDVLTAPLDLPRGRVLLTDIAGVDPAESNSVDAKLPIDPESLIARQMQTRAGSAMASADHLLLVQDATDTRPPVTPSESVSLVVRTKADLLPAEQNRDGQLFVSAHTGSGLHELRHALDRLAFGSDTTATVVSLNRRHLAAIGESRAALARGAEQVDDDAAELVAAELRESLDHLGSILGTITADDVLGRVFSAFCIGK